MKTTIANLFKPTLLAVAAGFLLAAPQARALIVENNLTGTVQYDGWDDFGGIAGYGSNDVGPTSNFIPPSTFGPPLPWPAPLASFETGSGDATLMRTSGSHYSAGFSLYTFAGSSGFTIGDSSAISNLNTVVFTIADWVGTSPTGAPTFNYNGGTQALVADYVSSDPFSTVNFGGDDFVVSARTFQWDLSGISGITDFNIDWTQGSSAGVTAIQLEQSSVFTVASATVVPEPTSLGLFGMGAALLLARRRK